MLNRYAGDCAFCGRPTGADQGDFQSIGSLGKKERKLFTGVNYTGRWLIRCFRCKGAGNQTMRSKKLTETRQ